MLITAIILFVLAAGLGVTMLTYLLREKHIPKGFAMLHGPLAAAGLVALLIYNCLANDSAWLPFGILTLAAIGGFSLLYFDLKAKPPKWLALTHGLAALTGLLLLLGFASIG